MLYLLNVSNPDRLSADSGWLVADILASAFADRGTAFTIAGPAPVSDPRAARVAVPSPGTKYRARFGFDIAATAHAFGVVRPDVVVANQIENAPGVRAAMLEASVDAMLAGYAHYVPYHLDPAGALHLDPSLDDGGLGHPVVLMFFAGLMACDRVLVHSGTAATWITDVADRLGLDLADRVRVVPPPADPRLHRDTGPAAEVGAGMPVGIYNHRLYAHYGTGRFVDLAQQLVDALPVRLQVTDLFGNRRPGRARLDASPDQYLARLRALDGVQVVSDQGRRDRYRQLVGASAFGLAPFRPGVTWSMSVVDCMAMGVPVLAPRLGWLAEFADPALTFDHPEQAIALVEQLLTDPPFAAACADRAVAATAPLAADVVADAYLAAVA